MTANGSLAHTALHALKWRYAGTICQVGLHFAVGVALARLLSPEAFGLMAMALIVIGFGKLVVSLGFGTAIIQRPSITQEHIKAAFTGSAVMGLVLFTLVWFEAAAISGVFKEDALTPVLQVVGISFVFSGMSATPVSLLRRTLRFRALAFIETAAYAVGFGLVGIWLAVLGYGVWSLVAANVVQLFCLAALAMYLTRHPVWPYFRPKEYRDLLSVGSAAVLNNMTNYVAVNLDFFVIGKWIGASALGLYNRAFYLVGIPAKNMSGALASVLFPVYAQVQGDLPRLGRAFLRTVSLTAMVTMPVLFAMAAAPEAVIGGLFGEQWKAAAGAFQILCVSGPFMAFIHVFGALNYARGYVFSDWGRQAIHLVIMGAALWFLVPFGITGVALAVSLATLARYLLLAQLSVTLADVRWKDFFIAHLPGFLLGVPVFTSAYLASRVATTFEITEITQLLLVVCVSLASLTLSLALMPSSCCGDLYTWIFKQFSKSMPSWLRRVLMTKLSVAADRLSA